ncbi:MAG: Helix-turn-helix domain [Bacteroidota bacterium]|jgi:transcriptional regulator with XRE-family HTH domain
MQKIIERIKSRRCELGYSQEFMAEKLSLDTSSYARIESLKTSISLERFLQICDILNLDPSLQFAISDRIQAQNQYLQHQIDSIIEILNKINQKL